MSSPRCVINYYYYDSRARIVEEWAEWPQGPRLQGEDRGKAGAQGSNKTTEQQNNRTSTRHRNIIDTTSEHNIGISVRLYRSHKHHSQTHR
jgi:hypothetical protein